MRLSWRRHARFLLALAIGIVATFLLPFHPIDRVLSGGDLFFVVYLVMAGLHLHRLTVADLRLHGEEDDEGGGLIVALALGSILMSMTAVILTMVAKPGGEAMALRPVLAVASVPLGWATLHMVMAFHYASLFYARRGRGEDAGGLDFPGTPHPAPWDFIYFSYTLGMTAQTSDTGILTTDLRRIVTLHSAISFFYNTVILALAVNLAVSL